MSAILLTLLAFASPSNEELAREAEAEFEKGVALRDANKPSRRHFVAAAERFDEIRRRGVSNAALHRNIGNAYFLAGDVPRAILAYRRGLRFSPGDLALSANLNEARKHVVFAEGSTLGRPPENIRPAWLPHAPRSLFALAVACYFITCLALTRWLMLRRGRTLVVAFVAFLIAACATSLFVAFSRSESSSPVVVIAENDVALRKGNGRSFPPRYEALLNRGVEAQLLHREDGWLQIELAGGEIGWVAANEAVAEDEP